MLEGNELGKTKGGKNKSKMPGTVKYQTPSPNDMPMQFYIGTQVMNSAVDHHPAWTFHQRIERRKSHYEASPNSYNLGGLKARGGKASGPAYSMRIKPQAHLPEELPGPSSYKAKPRNVLPRAPKFSFRRKPIVSAIFKTPAPNEYNVPTILGHHNTPPAYVMAHKQYGKALIATPGPGFYDHRYFLGNLPRAPQYTIRERITHGNEDGTPGPGTYYPEKVILTLPTAPCPSLGMKHSPTAGVWHPKIVGPRFC